MSTTHVPAPSLLAAEAKKKPVLIIDTNVLIKSTNLDELLVRYQLQTVSAVLKEIRDPAARLRLAAILPQLVVAHPDAASIAFISDFAKNTGDFVSLSPADIEVLALSYLRIKEKGKEGMLKKESLKPVDFFGGRDPTNAQDSEKETQENSQQDFEGDEEQGEEEETDYPEEHHNEKQSDEQPADSKKDQPVEQSIEEPKEDDDDGWITVPAKPVHTKMQPVEPSKPHRPELTPNDSHSEDSRKLSIATNESPALPDPVPHLWDDDKEFAPDSDEGWISSSNLNRVLKNATDFEGTMLEEIGVGVMTADFAMQNILLQVGIPLLSVNGMLIRQVKSYVLECFSCYKICRDNSKVFCPVCGNNTLLKVTCSFNEDGSFILFRKKDYRVNLKGRRVVSADRSSTSLDPKAASATTT